MRRTVLGLLGGMVALALPGCGRRSILRYRLTVEIATPAGIKSGVSILESVSDSGNAFQYSASKTTYGQAPYVDLGQGHYLFALLVDPFSNRNHTMDNILSDVIRYQDVEAPLDIGQPLFDQAKAKGFSAVVKKENYPLLVTFGNLADPATVERVDPDRMSAVFGPGYRLNRIVLQVVDDDEPLTKGIKDLLPWLKDRPDAQLASPPAAGPIRGVDEVPIAERISKRAFVSGDYR